MCSVWVLSVMRFAFFFFPPLFCGDLFLFFLFALFCLIHGWGDGFVSFFIATFFCFCFCFFRCFLCYFFIHFLSRQSPVRGFFLFLPFVSFLQPHRGCVWYFLFFLFLFPFFLCGKDNEKSERTQQVPKTRRKTRKFASPSRGGWRQGAHIPKSAHKITLKKEKKACKLSSKPSVRSHLAPTKTTKKKKKKKKTFKALHEDK